MARVFDFLKGAAASLRRFGRAEDGSYMVYGGLAAIPLVALAGLGVDMARFYLAEARLQSAIDAAAIAMGSAEGTDDEIKTLGRSYFYANFPENFWAQPDNLTIKLTRVDPDDNTSRPESFTISASARVSTLFFQMLPFLKGGSASARGDFDHIDVGARSVAMTEVKGLEVVMVLDVTGSMLTGDAGGERRIEAMRDAALNMINILFGDNPEPELLRVAIVPYNTAVNIGTDQHRFVVDTGLDVNGNPTTPNPFGQTQWFGCVQARNNDYDLSDAYNAGATDGSGEWPAYRWPIEPNARYNGDLYGYCQERADYSTGDYHYYEDPLDIETADPHPAEKVNYEISDPDTWLDAAGTLVIGNRYYDQYTDGPNKGCPTPLLPLTNNREEVWDYLQNEVTVVDGNGTITATGMGWAWRVISPGLPFDEGRAYSDPDWEKAIIVLTDGRQEMVRQHGSCDNITHVTDPTVPGGLRPWEFNPATRNMPGITIDEGPDYRWSAYGYVHPSDSRPIGNQASVLEDRLTDMCDAIKAVPDPIHGGSAIDIFAITFGQTITVGDTTSQRMAACTTAPNSNYFHAPDFNTLNAAFEEIARQLTSLRLTE